MAKDPGGNDKAAESIVHRVESHNDRVAAEQLDWFSGMLGGLEERIARTTQMQVNAAATQIEDKLSRHMDTVMAVVRDAGERVTGTMHTALSTTRAVLETHIDGRISAAASDINDSTSKQTTAASQQIQDTIEKRATGTDDKIAAAALDIKEYSGKAIAAASQQIQGSIEKWATGTDGKITELPATLAKMLNTMEVSVLARLLGLIDARLKTIEARLSGYAGPEQETEALAQWKPIADKSLGEATELAQIADTAAAEAPKAKDRRSKDEYILLAGQSYELALDRANHVIDIAAREGGQGYDAKAKAEADSLEKQAKDLIQKVQQGLAALRPLEVRQP
ncbi:MAG TPA: hypothetical protein VME47_12930 [Acetobacteraceae bacterium]|nr:hypothetical protein [Acetobacteraceae bacterium]